MENSNYSLSDIAAVSEGGFGGNNAFVLILLFAMIFGNGGFFGGRGAGDYGQFATAASQQEILFGQQFQGLDNKIDRLGNGIADATFALNNSVTNEGRGIQMQIANCCCENLRNTDSIRFDMSQMSADTRAAIHAEGEATRAMIQQDKIAAMQAKINQLETANVINAATAGVVKYPMSSTWSMQGNPFCNCGCNNGGCGC